MRGLSDEAPDTARRLRLATREALTHLVDAAIERHVDFLLIAGDLYDGDWRDYQTGVFFVAQMQRLATAGIPVYLIHGNHDAQNHMTRALKLPDNVHVFSADTAETRTVAGLDVALHGMSYAERAVTDNLVPGYPAPKPGCFNIGLLHTALGGRDGHANYAPCTLAELTAKGYDYWALGHVHGAEILAREPHVVFCGNLQGRSVRETGAKQAFEVNVEQGRVVAMTPIHCDVARWAVTDIDISAADDFNDVLAAMRRALAAEAAEAEGRLLAIRLRLTGQTALHDALTADPDRLLAEARTSAAATGAADIYVETVRLACQPPAHVTDRAEREDALGELARLLESAAHDDDVRAMIEADIGPLIERLPHDIRADVDDPLLAAAIDTDTATLVHGASHYLLARLSQSPGKA